MTDHKLDQIILLLANIRDLLTSPASAEDKAAFRAEQRREAEASRLRGMTREEAMRRMLGEGWDASDLWPFPH